MSKINLCRSAAVRSGFLSEIAVGIVANSVLLFHNVFLSILGHRSKPTDLPIGLLALIHLPMLVLMGFTARQFYVSGEILGGHHMESVVLLHRLVRGSSLCASCLLSVLQAITLAPKLLPLFKHQSPHQSLCSLVFLCSVWPVSYLPRHTSSTLSLPESLPSGARGPLQRVPGDPAVQAQGAVPAPSQPSLSPRASPELRVSRTILLLVGFFVLVSTLDYVIASSRIMWNSDQILYHLRIFVAHTYATVSPLVFVCTEKHMIGYEIHMGSPLNT
ncbi:Vomeronasal type-1 receptor 90 [Sciurus carolinensis]|uniref:Vomeronasal type-1 receptor n=1 Tax=Sciurus carolinensis TaxID=30640 RepID=A0AA41SS69_SCICA|nr:Vomeronasal type-1 receptor 90 [Sciurus carolinensis]